MNKREVIRFTREEISNRIKELGKQISKDYSGKELVAIGLLRGSLSSGKVNIISDLRENVEGKDVLIVDDIMDSGNTLKNIKEYIQSKNPRSIKTCVMLDKPSRRQVDITPDYFGYEIEDWFIVGYGLNYGSKYRNIPYIFSYED